jgi:hypothetical protein
MSGILGRKSVAEKTCLENGMRDGKSRNKKKLL